MLSDRLQNLNQEKVMVKAKAMAAKVVVEGYTATQGGCQLVREKAVCLERVDIPIKVMKAMMS